MPPSGEVIGVHPPLGALARLVPEHAPDPGGYVEAFSAGTHEAAGEYVSIVAERVELF